MCLVDDGGYNTTPDVNTIFSIYAAWTKLAHAVNYERIKTAEESEDGESEARRMKRAQSECLTNECMQGQFFASPVRDELHASSALLAGHPEVPNGQGRPVVHNIHEPRLNPRQ